MVLVQIVVVCRSVPRLFAFAFSQVITFNLRHFYCLLGSVLGMNDPLDLNRNLAMPCLYTWCVYVPRSQPPFLLLPSSPS